MIPVRDRQPVSSYIVRVYRRNEANNQIMGIVEVVDADSRLAFRSFSELRNILTGADGKE